MFWFVPLLPVNGRASHLFCSVLLSLCPAVWSDGILLSREHSQEAGDGLVLGGKGRMQTQWGEWVLLALA